ncbi:hypothetical protein CEE37_01440 [candidate division LCP-89 bacterium B3_LCP]|uniref:Aminotransferase class I/classII large domain-containing protein n=1 Tax=candidate division LCP-89 bacterium B3_LCP TaxID=2012998 RepID=A0A532V5B2_UNCL8|nr:MAG: hypothetical protein CEE37_01440 [candidate division LCP-89 bacterium B3_LCP]
MDFKPALYMEYMKSQDFSQIECNLAMSDIDCPYSLAELGITARVLETGEYHSYGNPELKEVIAEQYGVDPEQVLIPGGGSSLCNFLVAATLLGHKDQALVERPTYEPLRSTIESTGAEILNLPRSYHNSFNVDLDELNHLMNPKVKLVVLTRLHNPSGRDMELDTLLKIGEKAAETGAYVLVDEVYLDFLPENIRKPSTSIHPRLIVTSSFTKVYGLGTLRMGWAVAPKDLVEQCCRINNVLGVVPPMVPEQISLQLFQSGGISRIGAYARRGAGENIASVAKFIASQPQLEWVEPSAGIIGFIRVKSMENTDPLAEKLRMKFRTMVIPGSHFDMPDGFRLGFGCDPSELKEGLRRISLALNETDS